MTKNERPTGHVPIPVLGGKERLPHEERPSDRQIPANRPACPPIDDKDRR